MKALLRQNSEDLAVMRAQLAAIAVGLVFIIVTFRASMVAMGAAPDLERPVSEVIQAERRAEIVDRNGELLAASATFDSLWANPQVMWDAEEVAEGLASVFPDIDVPSLALRLSDKSKQFVWVRRKVSPRDRRTIYNLGLEGLHFKREVQRVYPNGSLAGHVIGHTNIDMKGIEGLEYAHNERLTGGGAPLKLTLDASVQHAIEEELRFAAEAFNIKGASGIVIEASSGAIRGMASWPEIDPNRPGEASAERRQNRASSVVYELGSVFKPLTVAAALDSGVLRLSDRFDTAASLMIDSFEIKDRHPIAPSSGATDIITHSSNIGTVRIAELVGARRLQTFFDDLDLLDRPEMDLPGLRFPIVPESWGDLSLATISYGHGIAVSPLALAGAYAAIANDGELPSLRLLESELGETGTSQRVMSAPTAKLVRRMLRSVVTEGTGTRADVYGYQVAGKTGTAEKPVAGGYDVDRNICSFAALFPASRPEYVVLIVLDEPEARPGEGKTAAFNAAPLAGRLIARIAPMLNVEPVFEDSDGPFRTGPDRENELAPGVRAVSDRREL